MTICVRFDPLAIMGIEIKWKTLNPTSELLLPTFTREHPWEEKGGKRKEKEAGWKIFE